MIDSAGLQGLDTLLSELSANGARAKRSGTNQVDIMKQIEQVLASSFGGADGFSMDSLFASGPSANASDGFSMDALFKSLPSAGTSSGASVNALLKSKSTGGGTDGFSMDALFSSGATGLAALAADSSLGLDLASLLASGSSASSGSSAPYSGGGNSGKPVANYFMTNLQKDFNLTPNQAAGIVANLWYESGGMNPGMNEGGHAGAPTSNMGQGYGVAQWTGSRKREFLDFAAQHHMNPSSVEANYAFLKHELQTTHSDAIRAVKGTSSARAATAAFCNVFERPGVVAMSARYDALGHVMPSGNAVMV